MQEVLKIDVYTDPEYYRSTEVNLRSGDPTKSKVQLDTVSQYDLAAMKETVNSNLKPY